MLARERAVGMREASALVAHAGTGTIIAGDVVTFAGTSDKYVVNTALSGGSFAIGTPGLRAAEADNDAITVGDSFAANVMLHRSCVELAMRPLEKPNGSDAAVDEMVVQDPHSGLVFRVSVYQGFYKQMIDITALYQAKAWKPDGIVTVLG